MTDVLLNARQPPGRSGRGGNRPLHGLYVITDTVRHRGDALLSAVAAAIAGGARIVQYRDKSDDANRRLTEMQALRQLTLAHGVLLLVNDDIALAHQSAADGVHLGRDDPAIAAARATLGPAALIGASCYDRLDLAERAVAQGADYCAFGAIFPSSTKPEAAEASLDLLRQARDSLTVPICAIGGINADNAASVVAAGADMLAVVSAVFAATDIRQAAEAIGRAAGFDNDGRDAVS